MRDRRARGAAFGVELEGALPLAVLAGGGCWSLIEVSSSVDKIDADQALLEIRGEGKTASEPVFGMCHPAELLPS